MRLPYQRILVCGDILVAASGGRLHTFNLKDGSHITTWTHPAVDKTNLAATATPEDTGKEAEGPALSPPAKRRKVEEEEPQGSADDATQASQTGSCHTNKRNIRRNATASLDMPMVIILKFTSDGRHLVAVTSTDKTIWVFEHDLCGNLIQISQR